jgi:hypothetical protein
LRKRKRVEELIESLFEAINISTNDSPFVQEILREIEELGFELQMRLIVGVVPNFAAPDKKENKAASKVRRKHAQEPKNVKSRLTQKDKEFLNSLGINI